MTSTTAISIVCEHLSALDPNSNLEQVFEWLACLNSPPEGDELRAWMNRFPQFKKEIVNFVSVWVELDMMPPGPEPTDQEIDKMVDGTMNRILKLLYPSN